VEVVPEINLDDVLSMDLDAAVSLMLTRVKVESEKGAALFQTTQSIANDVRLLIESTGAKVTGDDIEVVTKRGWLHKAKTRDAAWNKRWCILKGNQLFYYRSMTDLVCSPSVWLTPAGKPRRRCLA
jgi:hypothetical protein